MKTIAKIGLLSLFATATMLAAAHAMPYYHNYVPSSGAPWTGGNSSFDWTNWSYADSVLTNNSTATRTWTVPYIVSNIDAGVDGDLRSYAMLANSPAGAFTSGQAIANYQSGNRYLALDIVQATSQSLTDTYLGSLAIPTHGTAYVNFSVARSGGRIGRSQLWQQ